MTLRCMFVVALLIAQGCASKTTVFVSVYGAYEEQLPEVIEIVGRTGAVAEIIKVDPPAGAIGPVVIHGDSESAQATARRIAYDIYSDLGDWVTVRPVQLTNHSYSKNYVGLYLLDEASARKAEQDVRDSVVITPGNEYLPQQCDGFDGSIQLLEDGTYRLAGVRYDDSGVETNVSLNGSYLRSGGTLELRSEGHVYAYSEETVRWSRETVPRIRFVRQGSDAPAESVFACNFLQDVQVVPSSDFAKQRIADASPRPEHITKLFDRVFLETPDELFSQAGQRHMQSLPAVGREDLHEQVTSWPIKAMACEQSDRLQQLPIDEIAHLASQTRIVIINEAHDRPRHREFIKRVAIAIRGVGYNVFAAETFRPDIAATMNVEYARVSDGTYVDEPVFGRLVRDLKVVGYELRNYEYQHFDANDEKSQRQRVVDREEGQAENLLRILEELDENDRLLIHAGYSHASEVPIKGFGGPLAWMASRLKEKTAIDPLTVDQTDCLSDSDVPELMAPSRRHTDGQFDLVVGHPSPSFSQNRPNYRLSDTNRLIEVPAELLSDSSRVIVEAHIPDEPNDAVPIDRLMLWPGEALPLVLPEGQYVLRSYSEGDENVRWVEIAVDGLP